MSKKHKNKTTGRKTAGRKTTGVQGTRAKKSVENQQDKNTKKSFSIDENTKLCELSKELLIENLKPNPYAIRLNLYDASNFSYDEIKKLGEFISDNNIKVKIRSIEEIDFTEMVFLIYINSHLIFFEIGTEINMKSKTLISDKELKKIAKEISEIIVCDEKKLIKYYKENAKIEPEDIFEDEDEEYIEEHEYMLQYCFCGLYGKRRK